MLWLPRRAKVIDTAHVISTNCTWHGHPGLQARKLQATESQPPAQPPFLESRRPKLQKPQSLKLATPLPPASLASRGPQCLLLLLLYPSGFACEVTLKETLTFQGTRDFLRPGTGIQSLTCFGRFETSRAEFRSDALRTETVTGWDRHFGVEG